MKHDPSSFIGQTFNEMYRIVRPIGTGGMGAVFEATHTRLANKRFAVKMLHAAIAMDPEVFQRFRREAEIATELGHPHIVEVHDFNVTPDGAPYMVMEFLDGEDLASRIQKRGVMQLAGMLRIISEVCSGLDAAHNAGVVHRDLKPQNIFLCKRLGRDDFVKLVDFGVSKVRDSASVITRDHTLMGTPFYMSPEQADGLVQQIDNRTDIFALGAIMWEMLIGRMAFEAPTISGAMYKVVHVDPPEVHVLRPELPPAVSVVLRRAMAKDKAQRYANVVDLAADFANACQGLMPAIAPPPMQVFPSTMAPSTNTPVPVRSDVALAGTVATPQPGTPAPVVPSSPGMPIMGAPSPFVIPVSTVNNANGQLVGGAAGAAGKNKRGLFIGLAVAVVAVAGVVAVIGMRGGSGGGGDSKDQHAAAATADAGTRVKQPDPPPIDPPRDPTPQPLAEPPPAVPDAGVKVEVAPVADEVTLTVIVLPAGVASPTITVDGEPVAADGTIKVKKRKKPVQLVVRAAGYVSFKQKVVPNQDTTVTARLVKPEKIDPNTFAP